MKKFAFFLLPLVFWFLSIVPGYAIPGTSDPGTTAIPETRYPGLGVTSNPSGAAIYINGMHYWGWVTPCYFTFNEFISGDYTVVLPGYRFTPEMHFVPILFNETRIHFEGQLQIPAPPQNININSVNGIIRLNWDAVESSETGYPLPIDNYEVYGADSPDGDFISLGSTVNLYWEEPSGQFRFFYVKAVKEWKANTHNN